MPGERRRMQGNTAEYRGMPEERMGVGAKCQRNDGECRGIQRNTGECQRNVWEWVQSASGMMENAG